jgi:hypothetical protein
MATLLFSLLLACEQGEEALFAQFNSVDDQISVSVGGEEDLESRTEELHSSTGQVVIGAVSADPGGGPVGTVHTIVVNVSDEWENKVSYVTVEACWKSCSGASPETEQFTMETDSADEGLHQLLLESVETGEEVREDVFTIRLWEVEGRQYAPVDTGSGG